MCSEIISQKPLIAVYNNYCLLIIHYRDKVKVVTHLTKMMSDIRLL